MPVPSDVTAKANLIQDNLREQIESARSNTRLSDSGRQERVVSAYLSAEAEMTKLREGYEGVTSKRVEKLDQILFGSVSSVGSDAISVRDADDRASQLDSPDAAAALLERAESNGDTVLARAVALRAYRETTGLLGFATGGWTDVLDTYVERRPQLAVQVQEYNQLRRNSTADLLHSAVVFSVSRPPEIDGMTRTSMLAIAEGGVELEQQQSAPAPFGW